METPGTPPAQKRTMLVVDDSLQLLKLIGTVFNEDFAILTAMNGAQGVAMARVERPDIILLDIIMPDVSGVEMVRELQAHDETREIPVILMTGSNFDPSTVAELEREGNVKRLVEKPFRVDVLRTEIAKALGDET